MLSLWRRWLMPTSGSRTRSNHTSQRSTKSGIYSSQSHRKHPKTRKNWIRLVVIFIILFPQIAELVLTRFMWLQVSYNFPISIWWELCSVDWRVSGIMKTVILFFVLFEKKNITYFTGQTIVYIYFCWFWLFEQNCLSEANFCPELELFIIFARSTQLSGIFPLNPIMALKVTWAKLRPIDVYTIVNIRAATNFPSVNYFNFVHLNSILN